MNVLLVDDHVVVREGLRRLLEVEEDIVVIAEAGSLAEALDSEGEPDVIVTDLILDDANGASIVVALRERQPRSRILALTMIDSPAMVEAVLAGGAHGYLTKDAAAAEVVNALRTVASGRDYLQPELGAALARSRGILGSEPLSQREREVLRLIALGHTQAEISDMLSIAQRTVESHRASLSTKLGCRTRADLVRTAIELRIVDFR
jgi:two-component system, NarL family, response regulator NreC